MFLGESRKPMERNLFEEYMLMQSEIKTLRRTIEEFKSGKRYLKIQEDYRRIIKGYIKEIDKLRNEILKAQAETTKVRNMWMDQCDDVWQQSLSDIAKKNAEIKRLKEKVWTILRKEDEKITTLKLEYEEKLHEKDCIIEELKNKLAHAEALLGRDSTNTSLPTGQTPLSKEKHIPNSRRGSGKKKGGQPGHKKHTLEQPPIEEITKEVDHFLEEGERYCPTCGSENLTPTGEYEERYEIDINVTVEKTLHKFWLYQCKNCGEKVWTGMDPNLWAKCQYGPTVQAVALSLMNTANAAINKVPLLLSGMTKGEVCPSEGYTAKLMGRASKRLDVFMSDIRKALISRAQLYWDDTVAMANKERICLRFYGDENIAYYVAHDKKNMDGVVEDGILGALTEETRVMHDHNSINYNAQFSFTNVECNAHLQRDLQKIVDDTGHAEPEELKDLISATVKDRNDLMAEGGTKFGGPYVERFERKLTDILDRAEKTAEGNKSAYSGPFERAVIKRVRAYKENYFAWVRDFSIPTTNNLSERALRGVKTKMKVSGQFASSQTANNYARLKTYIETCRRNGINEVEALARLCAGDPFTVEEIFSSV